MQLLKINGEYINDNFWIDDHGSNPAWKYRYIIGTFFHGTYQTNTMTVSIHPEKQDVIVFEAIDAVCGGNPSFVV